MTEIPTYNPEDPNSTFPFDWEAFYEGENPDVSSNRAVTVGHSLEGTGWPRQADLTETDSA